MRLDAARSARRSSARCARSRSACGRRRPASPSAARARPAPRAAPCASGGWREWLRTVLRGARRRPSRPARRRPCSAPSTTLPWWPNTSAWIFSVSSTTKRGSWRCAARRCRRPGRRTRRRTACGRARPPRRRRRGAVCTGAAVDVERDDLAPSCASCVVAVERGRRRRCTRGACAILNLPAARRLLALARPSRRRSRRSSTVDAALAANVRRQVHREAVGVVQLERGFAVDALRSRRAWPAPVSSISMPLAMVLEEALLFLASAPR